MNDHFTPLSEIQKLLTFHPFKTYRLFVRFKKEGKLREDQEWMVRDKKILVDLPRFYTEIEQIGFKNFKRDEIIGNHMQAPVTISNHPENDERENTTLRDDDEIADDSKTQVNATISNHMQAPDSSGQPSEEVGSMHMIISGLIKDKEHFLDQNKKLLVLNQSLADQNRDLTRMTRLLVAPKMKPITEENEEEISNEPAREAVGPLAVNES